MAATRPNPKARRNSPGQCRRSPCCTCDRLIEVGGQVVDAFKSNVDPDQIVEDWGVLSTLAAWVIEAGCLIGDSKAPSETASATNHVFSRIARAISAVSSASHPHRSRVSNQQFSESERLASCQVFELESA